MATKESRQRLLQVKSTHHIPVAVVGSPVDPGTAAEEDNPVAGEGLAGMPPVVGHTGYYLWVGRRGRKCEQHVVDYSTTARKTLKLLSYEFVRV